LSIGQLPRSHQTAAVANRCRWTAWVTCGGGRPKPTLRCAPIIWFWHPNDEKSLKPLAALLETYHKTVGRGAQLMIGLAPDQRGLLPASDVARLKEFGAEIRRIYGADGGEDGDGPEESWSSMAPLEIATTEPMTFDRAVVMERLSGSQRVARYTIEAWDGGRWRPLAMGATIGHKKIDIFPRTTARRVRLRIIEASAAPLIRRVRVCDGGGPR
jgi:alpha-L-fucosidase